MASFFFFFVYFPLLENRELLGELDGIDVLLQQLSVSNLSASWEPGRAMACCEWVELGTWKEQPRGAPGQAGGHTGGTRFASFS